MMCFCFYLTFFAALEVVPTPQNVLEKTMGKWSILRTSKTGAPWRLIGCLLSLSTGL